MKTKNEAKYLEDFKKRPEVVAGNGKENVLEIEDEPCDCCAVFFVDYAADELLMRWENPRKLRTLVDELLEEGFGHLAMPALKRWKALVPKSTEFPKLHIRVTDEIWSTGKSRRIHDVMRPMSEADIDEVVKHDLALLQHKWKQEESDTRKAKSKSKGR